MPKRFAMALAASLLLAISLVVPQIGLSQQDVPEPLQFWTTAKSTTWDGTPDPRVRFMATTGASELSTGLQLSGFRGSAELDWVPVRPKPEVRRAVTLTALKARILAVSRVNNTVVVTVQPEPRGYELVGVDVTAFKPNTRVTFVFQNTAGTELDRDTVLVEATE